MQPPALSRRPQATTFRIEDLVEMARRGEVRIPRFHRTFRWDQNDIIKLLDSIYHGYPIGSLLLWKHVAEAEHVRFGPVEFDVHSTPEAYYIIDGQQRLTALIGVLLAPEGEPAEPWNLYFDLKAACFVPGPHRGGIPSYLLPMNVISQQGRLSRWIASNLGHDQLQQKLALQLIRYIQEYLIPTTIVDVDEPTVRVIFDRLNSTGKALKPNELFTALYGDFQKGEPRSLDALVTAIDRQGFGSLDRDWALKVLLAVVGHDGAGDARIALDGVSDLREALAQTERALRETLIFLKRDAGIPHLRVLPYLSVLMPLARFFSLYSPALPRSRELLSRWLWRGAITGAHRSSPLVRSALASMRPSRPEELIVQELLSQLPPSSKETDDAVHLLFRDINVRSASTKIIVNVLASLRPIDLKTGRELELSSLFGTDQPYLQALYSGLRPFRQDLVNMLLHPPISSEDARACLIRMAGDPAIRSHAISDAGVTALQRGDVATFMHNRKKTLLNEVQHFILARTRSNDLDRPSLRWLTTEEEEA